MWIWKLHWYDTIGDIQFLIIVPWGVVSPYMKHFTEGLLLKALFCSNFVIPEFLLRGHGWDRGASAHLPPLWPRFDSWIWCLLLVLVLAPRKKTTFQIPISPGNNGKEVPPWWNIFCIIYIIIITITQKAHCFVAGMLMLQYQPYINLQCP